VPTLRFLRDQYVQFPRIASLSALSLSSFLRGLQIGLAPAVHSAPASNPLRLPVQVSGLLINSTNPSLLSLSNTARVTSQPHGIHDPITRKPFGFSRKAADVSDFFINCPMPSFAHYSALAASKFLITFHRVFVFLQSARRRTRAACGCINPQPAVDACTVNPVFIA